MSEPRGDVIFMAAALAPFSFVAIVLLVEKYKGYHAPHAVALREREAKKSRYMAEFIGYGWSEKEAETRAEVRLNVEAKATENIV